ncbi:MAG: molybdopterin converting factor subunit 1 [Planctomycetes bacterium]|nr:molybdopterin converting factor subunit 1 [Planctomycetota bacterium]
MKLTVLYFAHLVERTGTREEALSAPDGATVAALRALLAKAHPKLGDALAACRVAVNEEFAPDSTLLREGNTVAFIPPVSGG